MGTYWSQGRQMESSGSLVRKCAMATLIPSLNDPAGAKAIAKGQFQKHVLELDRGQRFKNSTTVHLYVLAVCGHGMGRAQ